MRRFQDKSEYLATIESQIRTHGKRRCICVDATGQGCFGFKSPEGLFLIPTSDLIDTTKSVEANSQEFSDLMVAAIRRGEQLRVLC